MRIPDPDEYWINLFLSHIDWLILLFSSGIDEQKLHLADGRIKSLRVVCDRFKILSPILAEIPKEKDPTYGLTVHQIQPAAGLSFILNRGTKFSEDERAKVCERLALARQWFVDWSVRGIKFVDHSSKVIHHIEVRWEDVATESDEEKYAIGSDIEKDVIREVYKNGPMTGDAIVGKLNPGSGSHVKGIATNLAKRSIFFKSGKGYECTPDFKTWWKKHRAKYRD
ncbi:MAG TPA: hypothetical protein VFE47_11940 [Tepidisphaeraceae bacterium]|jgi:hypothetical protein|nr:hypothetical protein [Tepidisphaeraceae bacterium]